MTGYRYSLNGGSSWTYAGNVLSANLSGLTLSTQYTMLVQAGDAAGNWGPSNSGTFTTASIHTDNLAFAGGYEQNYDWVTTGMPSGSLPLSGGTTIVSFHSFYRIVCDPYNPFNCWAEDYGVYLVVDGFSGNPGAQWLQSIREFSGASAVFSCSSSTRCSWLWPTWADLTGSYTLTVVHY